MPLNSYRADIDGLRAIAVLGVLLYHIELPFITGGFTGVDVFFVISGYLITDIINTQIKNGTFRYKDFYLRRIRRLIPALLTVLIFSTFAAWYILLPETLYSYSKSALYSLIAFSNFFFYNETEGYFAADSSELPLLHTWSLSTEEQFYIIWPALLILAFKVKLHTKLLVSILVIGGLILSQWMAINTPQSAYLLLPARLFELAMGAALAIFQFNNTKSSKSLNNLISLAGLGLILYAFFGIDKLDYFPGFNAFIPCLGTALLIYTGSGPLKGSANQILTFKPLVFIGLISYSLYLWHWPLIAYTKYSGIELSEWIQLIIFASSTLLAYLTWKFVEQPFRFNFKWSFRISLIIIYLIPIALFFGFKEFVKKSDGYIERFPIKSQKLIETIKSSPNIPPPCRPGSIEDIPLKQECFFGIKPQTNMPDFIVIGDSHADASYGFFETLANNAHLSGLMINWHGTPFLINTNLFKERKGNISKESDFKTRNEYVQKVLKNYQGIIILAGRWPILSEGYSEDKSRDKPVYRFLSDSGTEGYSKESARNAFKQSFMETLEYLNNKPARTIVMDTVVEFPNTNYTYCLLRSEQTSVRKEAPQNISENKNCRIKRSDVQERQEFYSQLFKELAAEDKVELIDPKDMQCDESYCYSVLGNTPLYMDDDHISYLGGKKLAEKYIQRFGNPLIDTRKEKK